ncbi:MAG: hypothetical protein IJS19_07190 [Muribaculaceae bacterium]|nr:hypothetical protein [Muribaculaceae bacterium]
MKYSLLGFSQRAALSIAKTYTDSTGKELTARLDYTDLILLRDIADFMNRESIIKYIIGGKTFFSITYAAILEDLPLLDMAKKTLRSHIDKLVFLGLIEKQVVKNGTGSWTAFRLTSLYETLTYENEPPEGGMPKKGTRGMPKKGTPNNYTTKPNNSISSPLNILSNDNIFNSEDSSDLPPDPPSAADGKEIFEYFNNAVIRTNSVLPNILTLSDRRRLAVKARLREHGLEAVLRMIDKAVCSDFLNGKNNRSWRADFDWIFRPNNFVKILEGNYDNNSTDNRGDGSDGNSEQNPLSTDRIKIHNARIG